MDFETVIKKRYSCRKFTDEKVSDDVIDQILETGRIAPSGGNKQPSVVYVLKEKDIKKLEKLTKAKIHPVLFRAKQALLVCYDKTKQMKRTHDNFSFGLTDAGITTTYMMLKITELGLGSTWIGWFNPQMIKEALKLPEKMEAVSILAFGHIIKGTKPSVLNKKRKPMSEFKFEL